MSVTHRLSILFLMAMSLLQIRAASASQYEISLFRGYVSEFERADAQYRSAPSGSYQEQSADRLRREQAQYAQNIIRAPDAFVGIYAQENESLFSEFNSAFQSASSGSLKESIFDVARRAAGEGLKINAVYEIQNAYDYQDALQRTLIANQRFQSAASNSIIESVYDSVRRQGFSISKQKLADFLNFQVYEFRSAESQFLQLNQQFQSAASNSLVENYYDQGRRVAQSRAIELFRSQVGRMSYSELMSVEAEYARKYQSAPSNSLTESLYRSIRDEARARMGSGPGPNPYPTPYPNPQPQRGCQVMSGRDASGQLLYRVLDQAGRIIATTRTEREAYQISQNDARCR